METDSFKEDTAVPVMTWTDHGLILCNNCSITETIDLSYE